MALHPWGSSLWVSLPQPQQGLARSPLGEDEMTWWVQSSWAQRPAQRKAVVVVVAGEVGGGARVSCHPPNNIDLASETTMCPSPARHFPALILVAAIGNVFGCWSKRGIVSFWGE